MRQLRNGFLPHFLAMLLLSGQLPIAALADELPQLTPQAPSLDDSQPDRQETTTTPASVTMLNGEVHKSAKSLASPPEDNRGQNPIQAADQPSDDTFKLQGTTDQTGAQPSYELALKKLAARAKLTSDDYRSLGIGILGYDYVRPYFEEEGKVEAVYRGCPAEVAGIRLGDEVVEENVDDSNIKDLTRPSWIFTCGIAGQRVNVKIKRHGELLTFPLVRMNMEDIPDSKVRHRYEQLVQKLGASSGSVQVGKPITIPSILLGILGL